MSRTANSGAVSPGMQAFFARLFRILWGLRHAIFIGGMRKRRRFARSGIGRHHTAGDSGACYS